MAGSRTRVAADLSKTKEPKQLPHIFLATSHDPLQKIVLKVELQDKNKAMKAVRRVEGKATVCFTILFLCKTRLLNHVYLFIPTGTVSVSVDMKQKKLTVIGFYDPIVVVFKLRKHWYAEFVLIGRANEPGRGRVKERRETRS
ncbi:hypothetical protein GW17_00027721 [Ensete ventricosum]|nr:hypothetical protein GW17_00027721 [Ensete ventricosum]